MVYLEELLDLDEMPETNIYSDHDLLVRLNVLAEVMQQDVSEIKRDHANHAASTDSRIRSIETAILLKADATAVQQLQAFRWWLAGGLAVASIAASLVMRKLGI